MKIPINILRTTFWEFLDRSIDGPLKSQAIQDLNFKDSCDSHGIRLAASFWFDKAFILDALRTTALSKPAQSQLSCIAFEVAMQ
jgi:hypothetical protein